MSLFSKGKPEQPVYDTPSGSGILSGFTMRRVVTAAGRSFLSEKNLPIQPATNELFKKCFAIYDILLYKLDWTCFDRETNEFQHRYGEEVIFYEIPNRYYYPPFKLRQKLLDPAVNSDLSGVINNCKKDKTSTITVEQYHQNKLPYPSVIDLENNVPFLSFIPDFKRMSVEHISTSRLLTHENNEIEKVTSNHSIIIEPKHDSFQISNELFQTCLYDFSSYYVLFDDGWRPLKYGERNLVPIINETIDSFIPQINNCELIISDKNAKNFGNKINTSLAKFHESDLFGSFYIVVNRKKLNLELSMKFNEQNSYMLDMPSYLANKKVSQFQIRNKDLKFNDSPYKQFNIIQEKSLTFPNTKLDLNDRVNKSYHFYKNIKNISGKTNPIRTNKKYKSLRLALKLTVKKPEFTQKKEKCNLNISRVIKNIIKYSYRHRLLANYPEMAFEYKIPSLFEFSLDIKKLCSKYYFAVKNLKFINKCPKHGKYIYNLLHKILCSASFRRSKQIKHTVSTFKMPALEKNLNYAYSINAVKNLTVPRKEHYCDKSIIHLLQYERSIFNDILTTSKMRSIEILKDKTIHFNAINKLSKNRLKLLRIIKGKLTKYDKAYHQAYVSPLKRIKPFKQNLAILERDYNLVTDKTIKVIYSNKNRKLDTFANKITMNICNYAEYLPKQITSSFSLVLDIPNLIVESTLAQKEIIPPPGWQKQIKDFICKLRLGPHPFGFPEFFFDPPVFAQLSSKNNHRIIDITAEKVYREHDFILKKDKLYLPELSMKAPRRLLHQELTASNQPKEFYITDICEPAPQQNQPKHINNFIHSWISEKLWKCNTFFDYEMLEKYRNKKAKVTIQKPSNEKYQTTENFINNLKYRGMPKVTKFLLKRKKYVIKSTLGKILQNNYTSNGILSFHNTNVVLKPKTNFTDRDFHTNLDTTLTWNLYQVFPDTFSIKEVSQEYTGRFRDFRFPYVPESEYNDTKKELFLFSENDNSDCNCRFQEDFRVSQFDFGIAEINNITETNTKYNAKIKSSFKTQADFDIDAMKLIPTLKRSFFGIVYEKSYLKNTATPERYQHLISPRFFKINEHHSFKYMMRDQSRLSFAFAQIQTNNKINYSFHNPQIPNSRVLDANKCHWVILLRPNQINAPVNSYYSRQTLHQITINTLHGFNFGLATNELYSDKSNFDITDSLNQPPKTTNRIIENLENSISVKANTDLNITYFSPVSFGNQSNQFIKDNSLNLPDISKLGFKEIICKPKCIKVIEPINKIRKTGKGIINIPPFILTSPRASFSFTGKAGKRSDFKPLYLPDFLDIDNKREVLPPKVTDCSTIENI